jgi:four helix bundle protein
MRLARSIYVLTESFPRSEQFGLTSQMRRSAVSVPSNIAEGHGRLTDKGFLVFLAQARGSLYELQTQVELSADIGFCTTEAASGVESDCIEAAKILNGLMRSLRKSDDPNQKTA